MKSSLALVTEQLLRLEPLRELHFGVAFSGFSKLESPVEPATGVVVAAAFVLVGSTIEPGGGEVWRGVSNELKGTSGMGRSSLLTITGLLTTKAPSLIVSLRDFEFSSLQKKNSKIGKFDRGTWSKQLEKKKILLTSVGNERAEGSDPNGNDRSWALWIRD